MAWDIHISCGVGIRMEAIGARIPRLKRILPIPDKSALNDLKYTSKSS
jgi:hypothetical protein